MKHSVPSAVRLFILFIAIIILSIGGFVWWRDALSPVSVSDTENIVFRIEKGEAIKNISSRLYQEKLIKSPVAFYIVVKLQNLAERIQAGEFRLKRSMSTPEIAQELTLGMLDVWITTLEGWRNEEIAAKLSKELDIPESEFLKYAKAGYMFPDTYMISRDSTAAAIVRIFEDTFDKKISQEMKASSDAIGLSFEEAIILASIVEREGKSDIDRPVIAGILLNRLKINMPLQTDATLQYALGYQPSEKSWWKKNLTDDDKKVDSKYNTYKYSGLPPGPISNPGSASITAVLHPADTNFLYYLHGPDGIAHYAVSLEEHNRNILKYLNND